MEEEKKVGTKLLKSWKNGFEISNKSLIYRYLGILYKKWPKNWCYLICKKCPRIKEVTQRIKIYPNVVTLMIGSI
jgi:hypothetical protein